MTHRGSASKLASISSLGAARVAVLNAMGINSLRDFLLLPVVMDARAMLAAATDSIPVPVGDLLREKFKETTADKSSALPLNALTSFDEKQAPILERIGIRTISDLAALSREAETLVFQSTIESNGFSERPSAPAELIPSIIGSVSTNVGFSSFVQDKSVANVDLRVNAAMIDTLPVTGTVTDGASRNSVQALIEQLDRDIAARGLQKVLKELTDSGSSARSLATFLRKKAGVSSRQRRNIGSLFEDLNYPEIGLGYILAHRQRWINLGTNLGQLAHSLPLGPGEPRNIARVRYVRRQRTGRTENTEINERLDNDFTQDRALEEITSAVAREIQAGGTSTEAATSATALSVVGSLAIGAGAGAAIGTAITPGVGTAIGAVVGLGVSGALAAGLTASSAQALGKIESDSSGNRRIAGELQQRIQLRTSQTASALRAIYSAVIVEDTQSEEVTAETSNITNYNHMHALNMHYYEVLQHYLVTMEIDSAKPFLILPHAYLNFSDFAFIRDYWDIVRVSIADEPLRQQGDLYFVEDALPKAPDLETVPPEPERPQNFIRDLVVELGYPPPRAQFRIRAGSAELGGRAIDVVSETNYLRDRFTFRDLRGFDELKLLIDLERQDGGTLRIDVKVIEATIEGNGKRFELRDYDAGEIVVNSNVRKRSYTKYVDIPDVSSRDDRVFALEKAKRAKVIAQNAAATEAFNALQADLNRFISKLERYVRRHRYLLTRAILAGLEPEELTALLRSVQIQVAASGRETAPSGALPLSAIADVRPIGFTPGGIILALKEIDPAGVAALLRRSGFADGARTPSVIQNIANYAHETVAYFDNRRANDPITSTEHVLAPTGGLFAEAVLGRSNSAEYIDVERFFNFQDSPIPNAAPHISDVSTESRYQAREVSVTNPEGNLTIINPQAMPDPSGLGAALGAVQNGKMFRDMSKASELGGIVGSLATLAGQMATAASTMTGQAQTAAMQAANSLAQAAMQASVAAPKSMTERGGELNTAKTIDDAVAAERAPNPLPGTSPSSNSSPPDVSAPNQPPFASSERPPATAKKSLRQTVAEKHAAIQTPTENYNPEKIFAFNFMAELGTDLDGQVKLILRKAGLAIADEFGHFTTNIVGVSLDEILTFEASYAEMVVHMENNTVPLRVSLLGKAQSFGQDVELRTTGIIVGLDPNFSTYIFNIRPQYEEVIVEADTLASANLAVTGKIDFDFKSAAEVSGKGSISVGGGGSTGSPGSGAAKPLLSKLPKLLENIFKKGVRLHPLLALAFELVDASASLTGGASGSVSGGASGSGGGSGSVGGSVTARGAFHFKIPTGVFHVEHDAKRSG